MLAPLKTRWMPENESGLLKTQPSSSLTCSRWARCRIFVRTNEHRLIYMACGHWSGKYVLSILIGKADQKCLHSLVMDNGNINGLAPKLDSLTLYNIVQRHGYHVVILQNITWVIYLNGIRSEEYEVANAWEKTYTSEDGRILQSLRDLRLWWFLGVQWSRAIAGTSFPKGKVKLFHLSPPTAKKASERLAGLFTFSPGITAPPLIVGCHENLRPLREV